MGKNSVWSKLERIQKFFILWLVDQLYLSGNDDSFGSIIIA